MSKRIDLTGQKLGMLIVLSMRDDRSASGYVQWNCLCECGKRTIVVTANLRNGHTKSCGCLNKIVTTAQRRINDYSPAFNARVNVYKTMAKRYGRKFELTHEQCKELFEANCHYCNVEPSNVSISRKHRYIYNGIDRKDNTKDYTFDNCVTSCWNCNRRKRFKTYKEFVNE